LRGGSYWSPPPLDLADRLERAQVTAEKLGDPRAVGARAKRGAPVKAELVDALSAVLAAGLRQRVPAWPEWGVILRLNEREWATYRALRSAGARLPAARPGFDRRENRTSGGTGVCEDCHGVFQPARKAWAEKCPRCHASPRPGVEFAPYRTTVAVDRLDSAGEPVGWTTRTVAYCASCAVRFESARKDALYCSPRCRTGASRQRQSS
jgi:hypothetical protein